MAPRYTNLSDAWSGAVSAACACDAPGMSPRRDRGHLWDGSEPGWALVGPEGQKVVINLNTREVAEIDPADRAEVHRRMVAAGCASLPWTPWSYSALRCPDCGAHPEPRQLVLTDRAGERVCLEVFECPACHGWAARWADSDGPLTRTDARETSRDGP
jgi:hypothetical protein